MTITKLLEHFYYEAKASTSTDKDKVIAKMRKKLEVFFLKRMHLIMKEVLSNFSHPIEFWIDIALNEIKKLINEGK